MGIMEEMVAPDQAESNYSFETSANDYSSRSVRVCQVDHKAHNTRVIFIDVPEDEASAHRQAMGARRDSNWISTINTELRQVIYSLFPPPKVILQVMFPTSQAVKSLRSRINNARKEDQYATLRMTIIICGTRAAHTETT